MTQHLESAESKTKMSQELQTPSKLELRFLGPARVLVDGVPVDERAWTRRKSKALLKILALAPHHQLHREQLMEYLWPEMEPELALNNLHKAIHAARRALEPQLKAGAESRFLLTQDQQVLLRAPGELWIDVEVFEHQAETALKSGAATALESALRLYEGELLGEDRYEDWAVARREQVSNLAQRVLMRLAHAEEQAGQLPQSIERYRQLLTLEQTNEAAHRHLMRLYALSGSRHQALQQYQQCGEILRRELSAEPEAATVALYEQIVAGDWLPDSPPLALNGSALASETKNAAAHTLAPETTTRARRRIFTGVLALALLITTVAGFAYFRRQQETIIDSLVVLPFTNGSRDQNVEYLSDGITESLINSLSRLPNVRVMARTTAFRYKGRDLDPQTIGSELKVRAILTGKVLQRGELLVIQADLVDVKDGAQLWGAQYNRPLSDIFTVQAEIAREISEKLRVRLTNEEQERVAQQHTGNIEAYQAYLKGRYHWNRRTVQDLQRAIEYFNQAIAADPGYALAYAGLADTYHTMSNLWLPPTVAIPRAREAALSALKLDEQLAAPHASLAVGKWRYEWDWAGAEAEFKRALALDPNYPSAHQWYGQFLTYQKKFDAGLAEIQRAQQLDPLSLVITANIGLPSYFSGRYDDALTQFRRALEMDQNFPFVHFFIGWALEQKGDVPTALNAFERAVSLDKTPAAIAYLGHGHALAGNRAEAERAIQELKNLGQTRYVSPYYLAIVYAGLGETELTLDWLNKAVEDHSDSLVLLAVEPKFAKLHSHPRFGEIVRLIGLGRN